METWKVIYNFNKYEISTLGRIRNIRTKGIRRINTNTTNGYSYVSLKNNDLKSINKAVHKLMHMTYFTSIDGEVNHIDSIKSNNKLSNLEIVSKNKNELHKYGSKIRGIRLRKDCNRFEARIKTYGLEVSFGLYRTYEEAVIVIKEVYKEWYNISIEGK